MFVIQLNSNFSLIIMLRIGSACVVPTWPWRETGLIRTLRNRLWMMYLMSNYVPCIIERSVRRPQELLLPRSVFTVFVHSSGKKHPNWKTFSSPQLSSSTTLLRWCGVEVVYIRHPIIHHQQFFVLCFLFALNYTSRVRCIDPVLD